MRWICEKDDEAYTFIAPNIIRIDYSCLGDESLLIPYKIAPGGVSGIATVLFHLSDGKIPVGVTMLVINIPLFLSGLRARGKYFVIKSIVGAVLLSALIDLSEPWLSDFAVRFLSSTNGTEPQDLLLYAIAGGVASGLGLGFVFKEEATTGGTDMARFVHKVFPWIGWENADRFGWIGGSVCNHCFQKLSVGVVFHYSPISIRQNAGCLSRGINFSKSLMIISSKADIIAKSLMEEIDRGYRALW